MDIFLFYMLMKKQLKHKLQLEYKHMKNILEESLDGIWLPECGYVPEADKYLKEFGIEYIITETHGILYADPAPVYGTYAPIVSPNGVIAFGRDIRIFKTSMEFY